MSGEAATSGSLHFRRLLFARRARGGAVIDFGAVGRIDEGIEQPAERKRGADQRDGRNSAQHMKRLAWAHGVLRSRTQLNGACFIRAVAKTAVRHLVKS